MEVSVRDTSGAGMEPAAERKQLRWCDSWCGHQTKTQVIFHLLGPIDFTICFDLMTWQVVTEELDGESLFGSWFWGWVCLILFVFLNFKPTTNRRNWVECLDG